MGQLSTYITQVRALLHDPNGQMFSDGELTSYINQARRQVAQDTYSLRQLDTSIVLLAQQEKYVIDQTVHAPFVGRVINVIGIDVYWGNTRFPMFYAPWTWFSLQMRFWTQMLQRPTVFTRQGAATIYVGYTPDQSYITDWDIAIYPLDLVNDGSLEELSVPYLDPVQYWAARLAKFKQQALGEVDIFTGEYQRQVRNANVGFQKFVSNPLRIPYT